MNLEEVKKSVDEGRIVCSSSMMVYLHERRQMLHSLSRTAASIALYCAKSHEEGLDVVRAISDEYTIIEEEFYDKLERDPTYNEKKGE